MKRARALRWRWFSGCARLVPLAALVAGLNVGGSPAPARASEPLMIQVRGHSQLRLREQERAPTDEGFFRLTVRVELSDSQPPTASADAEGPGTESDGAADPAHSFANQRVVLFVEGPQGPEPAQAVTTGADGYKVAELGELASGRYMVTARYAGDAERDPAQATLVVDLGKQPTQLSLKVPPQAPHTGELEVVLGVFSEGRGLSGPVELLVGEAGKPLTVSIRRGTGQKRLTLLAQPWARKGQVLAITANYRGDTLHGSATQTREVLLTSQARLALEAAQIGGQSLALGGTPVELAQGSAVAFTGRVSDEDGPLADELVDVELSEQPGGARALDPEGTPTASAAHSGHLVASGLSDQNGRFRIVIPRLPLRPGPAVLGAQVSPRRHYILPGRAAELPLLILPPEPVSALYYVLPLLATALLGLSWRLARWLQPRVSRLLAAVRARWQRRAAANQAVPAPAGGATSASIEVVTGEPGVRLSHSRRLPGLTLRRTIDNTIDGQVQDASFGRPVSGAELTLQTTGAEAVTAATAAAAADGRFALSQLRAGRYLVTVSAPGYLPQSFAATIPHRGELRGVSVHLLPMRVRLLGQWQRVAQRLLGASASLQTATPSELLAQFVSLHPGQATARELHKLTDLVEQAYYSQRVCTPQMLVEATRLAELVLASRPASGLPLAPPPAQTPGSPMPLS